MVDKISSYDQIREEPKKLIKNLKVQYIEQLERWNCRGKDSTYYKLSEKVLSITTATI